ncbi:MAG: MFS transporter [Aquabacterium sp.]
MTSTTLPTAVTLAGPSAALWRYGLLGAPLAFVALPLYVTLPRHYAEHFGLSLATIGTLLLVVRGLDALVDPWLGRLADRWLDHSSRRALLAGAASAVLLASGFVALFHPPWRETGLLLTWCALSLVLTYLGYSLLSLLHQAWGSRMGGDAGRRAAVTGWREAAALTGVLVASVLLSLAGMTTTAAVLAVALAAGLFALASGPSAAQRGLARTTPDMDTWMPWRQPAFRALLLCYLVNGIASAIPATLVLFFIRDRLQAPQWEAAFLGAYFAAAALSMPLWLILIRRIGLTRTWLAGMLLAVATFVGAASLGAGDVLPFLAVCLGSGLALGADLAVPGALLTGIVHRNGHGARHEGLYLGWWNAAGKLNLALAAGVALPALQLLGYQADTADNEPFSALVLIYAVLPCALKLMAAMFLWRARSALAEDA